MAENLKLFEDGSSVEWKDRETLEYRYGERYVLVWVDYEPGIFSRGRVIKRESLERWSYLSDGHKTPISDVELTEIVGKLSKFLGNRPVRVE